MAEAGGAETIDFSKTDVYDELMKRTSKRGPDNCIDAVGREAGHGAAQVLAAEWLYDQSEMIL
jgi:threonine dehydrogenase-like Zn-dependent dehydrogenase